MAATEKRVVRERATLAVWRERVERWKSSGLTAKEFATTEDLSPRSLSWWQWRVHRGAEKSKLSLKKRRRPARNGDSAMSFLPVVVRPSHAEDTGVIEVVLPGEARVRVYPGFDDATLVRVVRALGAA